MQGTPSSSRMSSVSMSGSVSGSLSNLSGNHTSKKRFVLNMCMADNLKSVVFNI